LKPSNGLIGLVRSNADDLDAVFLAKTPADCRLGPVCLSVQHAGRWTGVFLGRSHNDASVSLPATNGWSMSSNARIPPWSDWSLRLQLLSPPYRPPLRKAMPPKARRSSISAGIVTSWTHRPIGSDLIWGA